MFSRNQEDSVISNRAKSLEEMANQAGRTVRNAYETASGEVSGAVGNVTDQMRKKPWQTGILALGAGMLLGMWLGRHHKA